MKQNQLLNSIHHQIFNPGPEITYGEQVKLMKPNPPTPEMIKKHNLKTRPIAGMVDEPCL